MQAEQELREGDLVLWTGPERDGDGGPSGAAAAIAMVASMAFATGMGVAFLLLL
ncbi:hypothetical protein BH24ACT26_BH24ACT26_12520 [soil metagenome]